MREEELKTLLDQVATGALSSDEAWRQLRHLPLENLGFAHVDHHRRMRHGLAEVVFGKGKTPEQAAAIAAAIARHAPNLLVTRADAAMYAAIQKELPEAEYNPLAGTVTLWRDRTISGKGPVLVVAAGTSDLPVAQEAATTARLMGSTVEEVWDVGVAGLHRLLHYREQLIAARVLIVVAGMEGALPSVVGGLVSAPVIAVPTSVGYGASFQGLAALLGMLNSCASNVTVVNIDNGFGAGYVAAMINRL